MSNVIFCTLAMLPAFAQVADGAFNPEAITRYGLLGGVLCWLMLRVDKRLAGIEHRVMGLNRTMLLEILSRPSTSERAQKECISELRKVAPDLADEMDKN